MQGKAARLYIGTSGYQYDHWRGRFYPEGLPKRRWFEHYASHFDALEVNGTFYSLPGVETFRAWREAAPADFVHALKFSRYGSHIKRLKDPRSTIDRFLERAEELGPALGPILVQLPPKWRPDPQRLDAFLDAAPAGRLWAVEVRDERWLSESVFEVIERHDAALCIHDMIPGHAWRITAGWTYLRYHGDDYAGGYSEARLRDEAQRISGELAAGRDVYAFFNNDAEARAVDDARTLRRLVSEAADRG